MTLYDRVRAKADKISGKRIALTVLGLAPYVCGRVVGAIVYGAKWIGASFAVGFGDGAKTRAGR